MVAPVVFGALLFFAFVRFVYPSRPASSPGEPVSYRMPADADVSTVAEDMGRLGLVDSPAFFSTYLRLVGAGDALRRGETLSLPRGLVVEQLARRLARGIGALVVRVTIPEGFDMFAVAERLEESRLGSREDFLRAMRDPALLRELDVEAPSLEGYLFPDTYELRDDESPARLLGRLVANHRRRVQPLLEAHEDAVAGLEREFGWSSHQILVLASVVEKEAAVADERAQIAGVFFNRLRSETFLPRQRLQSDPTVSYGCRAAPEEAPSCAGFDGTITRAMLEDSANRYNSYRHAGLPPGPIANPGLAAIEAVLTPASHDFFYFFARGGRRHTFSRTLEAHGAAVEDSRARGALR